MAFNWLVWFFYALENISLNVICLILWKLVLGFTVFLYNFLVSYFLKHLLCVIRKDLITQKVFFYSFFKQLK